MLKISCVFLTGGTDQSFRGSVCNLFLRMQLIFKDEFELVNIVNVLQKKIQIGSPITKSRY